MRVLVTGGAGFVGGHVADVVEEAGHEALVFDRIAVETRRSIQGDLLDLDALQAALSGVDAVCHLGAIGDVYRAFEDPILAAQVNVAGTATVMEAAKRAGTGKVIYASTWEVYGEPSYVPLDESHPTRPDHPYNITKLAGEHLVLSYNRLKDVPALVLRLGTAYGTRMRPNAVIPMFIDRALRGEPITIKGSGKQARQFTHARDIGRAFARALESDRRGEVFNIVGEEIVSIRELAAAVNSRLPTRINYQEARAGDVPSAPVSNKRAREALGWRPEVPFMEGLDEVIAWQRESGRREVGAAT